MIESGELPESSSLCPVGATWFPKKTELVKKDIVAGVTGSCSKQCRCPNWESNDVQGEHCVCEGVRHKVKA